MFEPKVEKHITFPLITEGECLSAFSPQVEMHYIFPTMYDSRLDQKSIQVLEQLEKYRTAVSKTIWIPFSDDDTVETLSKTLEDNEQYIPDNQLEQYKEIVKPALENTPKKGLTFSDIIAILTLLAALYTAILQSLPNKQLEQIINQNDVIIQNQEKMLDCMENDRLYKTLDTLTNSINLFAESLNDNNNKVEFPTQDDSADGKQHQNDTLD